MDKQKQIEEIILVVKKKIADNASIDIDEDLVFFNGNDFDHIAEQVAECLYLKGCRKIPEGAVVLTEEELKEKIDCCDVSMIHHDDDGKRYIEYEKYEDFTDRLGKRIQQLKGQLKQTRKETAEKFAERLKSKLEKFARKIMREEYQQDAYVYMVDSSDIDICIDEICKEITGVK